MSIRAATTSSNVDLYLSVMQKIRARFDTIDRVRSNEMSAAVGETIALHLRKIIEGIAYACVVATEHSVGNAPKAAKGHWNATKVFSALKKAGDVPFPDPNQIRPADASEISLYNVKVVCEGVEDARLSRNDLKIMYDRTHRWLHETNPYISTTNTELESKLLIEDCDRLLKMMHTHRIGINGRSFICTLKDAQDARVKVVPLEKVEDI